MTVLVEPRVDVRGHRLRLRRRALLVTGGLACLAFALFVPVIGFCTLTLLNSANATMQLESAPAFRGRVMALYMTIVMGGTPLGSPIIGWIGEHLGARWTLVSGGILTIAGVLPAVLVFARLSGGREAVLTPAMAPSRLNPRVWDDQTVARARK